jgi:hypothetical protein
MSSSRKLALTWPLPQIGSSISSTRISPLPWNRTALMMVGQLVICWNIIDRTEEESLLVGVK